MADNKNEGNLEKKRENNAILITLVVFNTVVVLAVAYFQLSIHKKQVLAPNIQDVIKTDFVNNEQMNENADEEDGILLQLNKFTANLAQGDKGIPRYIRLNLVLKFSKDSKEEEFKARRPQIRDVIINILNSKRREDLLQAGGKKYLKEEIKSSINSFLLHGKINDVFYIGFQIS